MKDDSLISQLKSKEEISHNGNIPRYSSSPRQTASQSFALRALQQCPTCSRIHQQLGASPKFPPASWARQSGTIQSAWMQFLLVLFRADASLGGWGVHSWVEGGRLGV